MGFFLGTPEQLSKLNPWSISLSLTEKKWQKSACFKMTEFIAGAQVHFLYSVVEHFPVRFQITKMLEYTNQLWL